MFGTYKFRDHIAQQDCGYLGAFTITSGATVYYTGGAAISTYQTIGGSNNFHKLMYRMIVPVWGQVAASNFSHGSTAIFLASPITGYGPGQASSSVSSVSSNWSLIDASSNFSGNLLAAFYSASSSVSGSTYVAALDIRPEKFSAQYTYITPVVVTTVGANTTANAAVVCDAYMTDFQPALKFDAATVATAECDYL